jgi:membrane protease subunit HflC
MTVKSTLAAIAAAILLLAYMAYFTVDERQKALVQRFGEVKRVVEQPGLYFKLPMADTVTYIPDTQFIWNSDNMEVQVSDKKQYTVDMVTVVRIDDARKFREAVGADVDAARANIETRLDAALRQTYGKRTFEAALSKDRVVMMREIRDAVRADAQNLGIEIVDVRIRRTDLMKEVLDSTYERMKSERLAEAQDLRSTGVAMKTNIEAQADRKVIEKISDATRQSEIIRGTGEGERSQIFAEAYTKDPEFYSFYRSMQAYVKSLGKHDTTLVLSPDSDFFRYFGTQTNKAATPATP